LAKFAFDNNKISEEMMPMRQFAISGSLQEEALMFNFGRVFETGSNGNG